MSLKDCLSPHGSLQCKRAFFGKIYPRFALFSPVYISIVTATTAQASPALAAHVPALHHFISHQCTSLAIFISLGSLI